MLTLAGLAANSATALLQEYWYRLMSCRFFNNGNVLVVTPRFNKQQLATKLNSNLKLKRKLVLLSVQLPQLGKPACLPKRHVPIQMQICIAMIMS